MDDSFYPNADKLHYMEEDIEVSDGKYERIQIPKFDECEDALVLHDFEKVLFILLIAFCWLDHVYWGVE